MPTERHNPESHGTLVMLRIRRVQPMDFGNYSCQAENSQGISRDHIELTGTNHIDTKATHTTHHLFVHLFAGRPQIAVINSSPEGLYRTNYNLTWTVRSIEPLSEVRLLYRLMV